MRNIYIFCKLIAAANIFAQAPTEPVQIKSPQSYAFEKYGNVPVNLYIGAVDLKIPVTAIKAGGLEIGATLIYDSSGFIPHKKSDAAGMNWSLLAGGRITRQLNLIPDEYVGSPQTVGGGIYDSGKDLHGFLKGVRTNPSNNISAYNLHGGTGNTDGKLYWWMGPSKDGYEGTPDTFNFNAEGLSGKFIIGNDGNVLVEADDPNIEVDISKMATYSRFVGCTPPSSEIIITNGKGIKYVFGGDMSKYEISYNYNRDPGSYHGGFQGYPMISSFSLSKIILPNKTEVIFSYEDGLNDNFCDLIRWPTASSTEKLLSMESYFQDGGRSDSWKNCPGGWVGCGYALNDVSTRETMFVLLKKSVLKSIKYLNDEIKLNYTSTGYPIKHHELSNRTFNEWLLSSVDTYAYQNLINKTEFSYVHLGGTFKRPFLSNIRESASGRTYAFEYNNTSNLPAYYTMGLDHWGYWNGKDHNTTLVAYDTYNGATGDYTLNNTVRDADPSKYNIATLSKITYPTKGYTTFEYEPHYYGKRIERTSSSKFLPVLTDNAGLVGGTRVKKITHYAEEGIISKAIDYKYTNSLHNPTSSGILMNWPRYIYYIEMYGSSMVQKMFIKSSSNVQRNSLDSYNVGYSTVLEIENGKGYTEHNFTNYSTNPDQLNPDTSNLRQYMTGYSQFIPENLYKNFKNLYGIDKSTLRGRPSSIKKYAQSDLINPINTISYEYHDNIDYNPNNEKDNKNYVSLNHLSGFWVQGYRRFMNAAPVKKITTTDYLNGSAITSYKDYFYTSSRNLNLTEEKTTFPSGESDIVKFEYAEDLRHGNQPQQHVPPYESIPHLVGKNMTGIPLITTSYSNDVFQSRNQITYEYDFDNLAVLPKQNILYHEDKLVTSPNYGYAPVSIPDPSYGVIQHTYDIYDEKSNLLQYTSKTGVPTAIVWGYDKTQPIAKVEGATYAEVSAFASAIIAASNNDAMQAAGNDESTFLGLLDAFRNNLHDYPVTTYTYDPLRGVRSITPPSGLREFYSYDNAGRLKSVKDSYGKDLKKYHYNYKTQ